MLIYYLWNFENFKFVLENLIIVYESSFSLEENIFSTVAIKSRIQLKEISHLVYLNLFIRSIEARNTTDKRNIR